MRDLPYSEPDPAAGAKPVLSDVFEDDHRAGTVLGSRSQDGWLRHGVDRERRIAIDHGALRFQPLVTPGWGRQGIAYGPFPREPGLALAVAVTNGHGASEVSSIDEGIARRLWRWVRGPGIDPIRERLIALARGPRKRGLARRVRVWLRLTPRFFSLPDLEENLAVGWFAEPAPSDPTAAGSGFVIRGAYGDNSELRVRHGDGCLPAVRGLKNVQLFYIVVLREHGAICYAAAGPDAAQLPAMPMMRPIAIDPCPGEGEVYAGVHQSVLGQIGFRVDTRVHGVKVASLPRLALAGPGQAGDGLTGSGGLGEAGSGWQVVRGALRRTADGAACDGGPALAVLDRPQETGLVHALFERGEAGDGGGLVWRFVEPGTCLALEFAGDGARLVRYDGGTPTLLAEEAGRALPHGRAASVQVTDAAGRIGCHVDGALLFGRWFEIPEETVPGRAGFRLDGPGTVLRDFEIHPRAVPVPPELRFPEPWRRFGTRVVLADRFAGAAQPLAGRAPDVGDGRWQRLVGCGDLATTGDGARVQASVAAPHPGRTFHALPWTNPGFADLETEILPPGSRRGEREHCRSGLLFWQDADNYLSFSIYLSDEYDGASVAVFTKRHGFEEIYDAVWTMVGGAITWGRPFRLRVTFDGDRFAVFLDGEAITERALSDLYPEDAPLRIGAVGLATNWEWGDDTGSIFREFVARM